MKSVNTLVLKYLFKHERLRKRKILNEFTFTTFCQYFTYYLSLYMQFYHLYKQEKQNKKPQPSPFQKELNYWKYIKLKCEKQSTF